MTDTFDSLRPMLETYLRERGIDPRKRFRCLNPEHFDHDPSMGYDSKRHKVHCFACGADYDLFDLLQMNEHLSSPLEALSEASRRYGHGNIHTDSPASSEKRPTSKPQATAEAQRYIVSCAAHRGETDYFVRRSLSEKTAARFQLGYDSALDCVVLPCDGGHIVRRAVAESAISMKRVCPRRYFRRISSPAASRSS